MVIAKNILLMVFCALLLIKAVNVFIDSTTKIAQYFKISGYTISFLLVALATSLPEVVVAVTSSVAKKSLLSYGDAMGSNIALITLVISLPILLGKSIATRSVLHSKDIYYATFFAFLPALLSIDGDIKRSDGIILIIAYIAYLSSVIKRSRGVERILQQFDNINILKSAGLFALSLSLLLISSRGIVLGAINLSVQMGWALSFVGLTIIALGTSLPEIAFVISSEAKDNQREILGDIVGSVVANSTLILGLASIIYPIRLTYSSIGSSTILFLTISLLLFLKFTISKQRLEKFEALILISVYVLFILTEYFLQLQIQ